jgi:hypothetical protein
MRRPSPRTPTPGRRRGGEAVLCASPRMRPGTVVGCSVSLLAAGVLLARGFIGILPSRPFYLLLGGILAASALLGLVVDHVSVIVRPERPDHVLVTELDRSRRHGHPLSLAAIRCDEAVGLQVVSHTRTTDRSWRARGRLYVLLVDTDADGAAAFAARLAPIVAADDVRWASFPTDALTSEGLYAHLDSGSRAAADVEDAPPALAPVEEPRMAAGG